MTASEESTDWRVYHASGHSRPIDDLPPPPPWRVFDGSPPLTLAIDQLRPEPPGLSIRAKAYQADEKTINLVNAAILLRRPVLATGKPGTGKSTLARSIAYELGLGPVISWPITSRSTLRDALYQYDAIGRFQGASQASQALDQVGRYITLGPLGTAMLPWRLPRVLLIDELDKSDIDLPNDLLHIFEEGHYDIPELGRLAESDADVDVLTCEGQRVSINRGHVLGLAFPIIVITSNGEREFPPAFLRRCIRVDIAPPREEALARIIAGLLGPDAPDSQTVAVREYLELRESAEIATDQLLNALFLVRSGFIPTATEEELRGALLRELDSGTP